MDELAQRLTSLVDRTRLREAAETFSQSRSFIDSNQAKLFRQYRDCWIAVYKDRVIASGKDLRKLVNFVRKSDVPLEHVAVELLNSERHPIHLRGFSTSKV